MSPPWRAATHKLPITPHLSNITHGISQHAVTLLEASPGSGKTTVIPLALLEEPWLNGKKILILQPRRVAARTVAKRMSDLLSDEVGGRVGYRIRLDNRCSARTRIEVITEGLLTRRLVADPELSDVGVVIFDEFHERSIHADVGLALTLESAAVFRPDLKIVIMSATLGDSIPTDYLAEAWRYTFEGTPYPVRTTYEPGEPQTPVWERVAKSIRSALRGEEGDLLAFLPGAYEIERTQALLESSPLEAIITPLYGDLSYPEQERAITPDPQGRRKVILATTIAETSLTIEGVQIVIDSGLHKVSRSDTSGYSTLATEPITRDAADQRAGRAGRTAPGCCIRLWSEHEHQARRPYREPEILRSDLAPTILDLASWGVISPQTFRWITRPSTQALESAAAFLLAAGALGANLAITPHGKLLASLGTHPRLGALALKAREHGLEHIGADLLALLEERDVMSTKAVGADIALRLDHLHFKGSAKHTNEVARRWRERIATLPGLTKRLRWAGDEASAIAFLLASAFPERIARRRESGSGRYLLASGKGASLRPKDPLSTFEYLAVASIQEGRDEPVILLAASLPVELFKGPLSTVVAVQREISLNEETGSLQALRQTKVGALVITSSHEPTISAEESVEAFANWLSTDAGFAKIPWPATASRLRSRVAWARQLAPLSPLADLSDSSLKQTLTQWLVPFFPAKPSLRSLTQSIVQSALDALLPWALRKELDAIAPESLTLPSGKTKQIEYADGDPWFEARIQEVFGMRETPRIGRSQTPLSIHLLSPAQRPVQVTKDLASFWKTGYPEVRRELRGRYPKHRWPEDPLE